MINKVSFTGRETMLTAGLEKGAQKTVEVIEASSVLPEITRVTEKVKPQAVTSTYTSPFAPTGRTAQDSLTGILDFFG